VTAPGRPSPLSGCRVRRVKEVLATRVGLRVGEHAGNTGVLRHLRRERCPLRLCGRFGFEGVGGGPNAPKRIVEHEETRLLHVGTTRAKKRIVIGARGAGRSRHDWRPKAIPRHREAPLYFSDSPVTTSAAPTSWS
jgi:hypothetical protein